MKPSDWRLESDRVSSAMSVCKPVGVVSRGVRDQELSVTGKAYKAEISPDSLW